MGVEISLISTTEDLIMNVTDAVNPDKNVYQQGAACFKQVNCVHQQILMLAALALRVLGLPVAIRDIIFLHGGECFGLTQWSGVIQHFFELLVTRTDADIKEAAKAWCRDPRKALVQYGHISCWKVSQVTDMYRLFQSQSNFNDSLYYWDVRNVVTMDYMFSRATSFDQNLSAWDIKKVRDMREMFAYARAFNQDLDSWQVSADTNTFAMFRGTSLKKRPAWFKGN